MSTDANVTAELKAKDTLTPAARAAVANLQKSADAMKATLEALKAKFLAFGGLAGGAFTLLSGAAASRMLETAKQARMLGTTLEQMQTIMLASKKGPEEISAAVLRMNMTLGMARQGSKDAIDALRLAGMSQGQIATASSGDALLTIVKGLGAISDPAIRAAEAMRIFGREGQMSVQALIAGGAGGLEEARKKLAALGISFSPEDEERLKKAKEAVEEMRLAMGAFAEKVAIAAAPAVKAMAERDEGLKIGITARLDLPTANGAFGERRWDAKQGGRLRDGSSRTCVHSARLCPLATRRAASLASIVRDTGLPVGGT